MDGCAATGDLVIEPFEPALETKRIRLLDAQDYEGDVIKEFQDMKMESGVVKIQTLKRYYHGATEFTYP